MFRTFLDAGVRVTVSTDGPEMMRTHLRDEFAFLCAIGAMSADEARAANALAHAVSFVAARTGSYSPARCRTSYSARRCTHATRNRAGASSPSPVGRCRCSTRA